MLSVADARAAILAHCTPLPVERVPLLTAVGRTLGESVAADQDSPPFDKSMMDGFAVIAGDAATTRTVIETVTAGRVATRTVTPGTAVRIMTGAAIPAGADAVVPVERTELITETAGERVRLTAPVAVDANILRRGESVRAGEMVYPVGHRVRPQDVGVLAELGVARPTVRRRPRVAVLATGDELVPPDQTPGPGQIRNSNESLLIALTVAAGAQPVPLGIARDDPDDLGQLIAAGLDCDLLLLSGGVSAGTLDLVPAALAAAGIERVFHKVNIKPGKPLWFGVGGSASVDASSTDLPPPLADSRSSEISPHRPLTFGLPGNPVAVLVGFQLFVGPAIDRLLGREPGPNTLAAVLSVPFANRGDRPVCHPARWTVDANGQIMVRPVRWAGSADLRATADANAVAVFAAGRTYDAGDVVVISPWPGGG